VLLVRCQAPLGRASAKTIAGLHVGLAGDMEVVGGVGSGLGGGVLGGEKHGAPRGVPFAGKQMQVSSSHGALLMGDWVLLNGGR